MDRSFCYKPLDDAKNSIRLVRILSPTNDSDTICCSLVTAHLDKKPSYEALSYVWGSEPSSTTIQCDGRDISITRNLCQALRSLQRLEDSTNRLFWIDALCINQNDIAERSSQIGLIFHIYSAARNVIVWPGEPASDGHPYSESVNDSMVDVGINVGPDDSRRHERSFRGSILKYLKAPIFRRAWVLQEILCSRKTSLLLDDGETEWETFWGRAAIEIVTSIVASGDRSLPTASMAAFQFYTATSSIKFIASSSFFRVTYDSSYEKARASPLANAVASQWAKTLDFTATLNTTDPRDRVFALVGLADAFGIIVPKPDYSKSTRLVFQEALSMLRTRNENGLSPLHFATALQNSSRGLALLVRPRSDDFKTYPADSWQCPCPSENSPPSPPTGGTEFVEGPELSYHAFFDHILQHHKRLLCSSIVHHLADKVPHGPLTCLAGADSTRRRDDQQASGPRLEAVTGRTAAVNARSAAKRKRQRGHGKRRDDDDEDDDEEGDDEQKHKKQTLDPWKRFACPYFQRNMECPRLRTACRGPGFETTARLKEHLYRAHHIHPCLRCGKIFESREAVGQHSQLIQPCNPVQWRQTFNPSQGFEDLQKEKLGKKTVRTWQQIFSILFPRDDPNTYPPQHYSNTGIVQLLDQFHQHYLAESQRILPQRLANDSSTIHGLHQGQPGQWEAYVLQLVNDIFAQIIGTFRAELIRTPPPDRDVRELAPHTADHALRFIEAALPHGEEPVLPPSLQPILQSAPPSSRVGAIPDPVVAFEQYLTRFAPVGTFDDLPDLFEGAHDAAHGRQEYDWEWEDLGPGSG